MRAKDLSKSLGKYKSGWVAVNQKNQEVVLHGKDFAEICKKVGKNKNLLLVPASNNYFGFVTSINGKVSLLPS